MLVSGYFSHKNSHNVSKAPWMAEHRQRLRRVSLEHGLKLELEYSSVYFDALARWNYDHPQVYETNFETLVRQPQGEFARIFQFLGITISPIMPRILALRRSIRKRVLGSGPERRVLPKSKLKEFVSNHSFERQSGGRKPGVENQDHHYRKGTPGDWKTYFFPELRSRFKGRYGELLIKLGYETSLDW